jgi:hypothetical protein
MHAAVVALSELHEAVFADHMTRTFGVEWEARDMGRDRNPAWAITAVPETLVTEFSSRSRHIDAEKNRLIAEYVAANGRQPSNATILKLRAGGALHATGQAGPVPGRPDRGVAHSSHRVLGQDAARWAMDATDNDRLLLLRADDIPLDVIRDIGRSVVETVGEKRSTWRDGTSWPKRDRRWAGASPP